MRINFLQLPIFIILISNLVSTQVHSQDSPPCILPTIYGNTTFVPGGTALDILDAINNDPNLSSQIFNMSYCSINMNLEGLSNCFSVNLDINPEGEGGSCLINTWELMFYNNSSSENCCGRFTIPYWISYYDEIGNTTYCTGIVDITVACPRDCGIIDFTDPEYANLASGNGGGEEPEECIPVCEESSLIAFAPVFSSNSFQYDWNVIGGIVTSGQNTPEAHIQWWTAGAGNISVTISNSDPNYTPITYETCIEILEGPEALFTSSGYACLGAPIDFIDASSSGSVNYFWDFGDGQYDGNANGNTSHTYNSPGTFDVTLTVYQNITDENGNVICVCSDMYTDTVEIDPLQGPDINCVSTLCEGDTSSYSTTANCPLGGYTWAVYDANNAPWPFQGQGTNEIFVQWGAGPYGTVELEVSGCTPSYCTTPTSVQIPLIPSSDTVLGPVVVCEGEIVTYNLTLWPSVDYNWDVIGGNIISQNCATATIEWTTAGQGEITVEYSSDFLQELPGHDSNDCFGTAHLDVDVRPEFNITPSTRDVCITGSVNHSIVVWGDIFDWTSSDPNFTNTNGTGVTTNWNSAGTYTVTATTTSTNSSNYCNTSSTGYVNVIEVAPPTVINGPDWVCAGSNAPTYIYESPLNPGYTLVWTPTPFPSGGLPSWDPVLGPYTEVQWGPSGPFTIGVTYQLQGFPSCESSQFVKDVYELTLDPNLTVVTNDAPCANEQASYEITGMAPGDPSLENSTLTWSISPPQHGSIISGQGTSNITIQWNDIPGNSVNALITAHAELCDDSHDYTLAINLNRAIVPQVVGTDFCVGVDINGNPLTGTVEVINNNGIGGFTDYDWSWGSTNSATINPTTAGEYLVTTTDQNGCTSSGGATINLSPAPMLSLTYNGSSTLCNGNPVSTEIVAPTNGAYSYVWTCSNNNTGITTNVSNNSPVLTHSWIGTSGGNTLDNSYTYELTVTESPSGCMNTKSKTVYEKSVCDPPLPCPDGIQSYTLTPSSSLQNNFCDIIDFTVSSSNVSGITWDFGDPNSPGPGSGSSTSHAYSEIGYYTVVVSGTVPNTTNTTVCTVAEAIQVVVSMTARFREEVSCQPSPADSPQICLYDETAYIPGTGVQQWLWSIGVNTPTATSLTSFCTSNLVLGSTQSTTLVASHNPSGCISEHSSNIDVPGPVIISGPNELCLQENGLFNASLAGGTDFIWNFDDSNVDNQIIDATFDGEAPAHAYAIPSSTSTLTPPYNANVSVTATHATGCEFSASLSVIVNDLPSETQITSQDGDFKFCVNGIETLEINPPPNTNVQWWFGSPANPITNANSSTLDIDINTNGEGEYGVTLTDDVTLCETVLEPVLVQTWPEVPSNIMAPSVLCDGDCTDLNSPSLLPLSIYSYLWESDNNGWLGFTNSVNICYDNSFASDEITLTVTHTHTNSSTCSSSTTHTIDFEQSPSLILGSLPDPPCEGTTPVSLFVDGQIYNDPDYVWSGGVVGPLFTTSNAGTYTAVVTDPSTGCSNAENITVFPCPNLCSLPYGCYTVCENEGSEICAPSGLASYQWDFIPAGSPPGTLSTIVGTSQCFTMMDEGDYTLTASNNFGCYKTSKVIELETINCDDCQFEYSDMLDLQLQSLGTQIYDDEACCVWSIDPLISTSSGVNINDLCMEIYWGDGDYEYNVPLGVAYEHCYEECADYNLSVKIKCCADGSNSHGYTGVATCGCVPDCYIRTAFWETITPAAIEPYCHVIFNNTQFIGPDMVNHQNPVFTIVGTSTSGTAVNINYSNSYNYNVDLLPGTYTVCRSIDGVSELGEICSTEHCHEVIVDCCESPVDCDLPEEVVFYPEEYGIGGAFCPDGECEWHFCLGSNIGIDSDEDHCISWDFGDGTTYNSNEPECATHCYSQSGTYDVCLTIYCCDDPSQSVEYCETIDVSCGSQCNDCENLEIEAFVQNLGTEYDPSGVECCVFAVTPQLGDNSMCDIDIMDLCIDLNWGDGSGSLLNVPFAAGYTHCFPSGISHEITMDVYCCHDGSLLITKMIEVYCNDSSPCDDCVDAEVELIVSNLGENINADGVICCEYGITPQLLGIDCPIDVLDLCMNLYLGDGTTYLENVPFAQSYTHCYPEGGSYQITMEVFCCDMGADAILGYHSTVVECDGGMIDDDCSNCGEVGFLFDQYYAGSSELSDGSICCEYGITPELLWAECDLDIMDLCIDIHWGDGSNPLVNVPFAAGYTHCFPSWGEYDVLMDVYCCETGMPLGEFGSTIYCEGNNSECEIDFSGINMEYGVNSTCPNGCDEYYFCAGGIDFSDPNICLSWDFGDGNIYNPQLPDCPIHCYNSDGIYTACLTVYCCAEGVFGPSAYTICEEVIVNCGVTGGECAIDCPELEAGLGLVNLGSSTDASGTASCDIGLVPELFSDECQINLDDLCINVDWGDGSAAMHNVPFTVGYTHVYPSGSSYIVTMDVYCCNDDGDISQVWTFTDAVTCLGGGGGGCDLPEINFEWGINSDCSNGCDEVWFCASNYPNDENICLSWDFGDGNIYNPALPECPIHCYNDQGIYNTCLTVYCCEEGPSGPSTYTICQTVNVSCGEIESSCNGDLDLDGFIGVSDLLELLVLFGDACQ